MLLFVTVFHLGNVFQVGQIAPGRTNEQVSDLFGALEFAGYPKRTAQVINPNFAPRNIHILAGYSAFNVAKGDAQRLHPVKVYVDLNFALEGANQVNTGDFREAFNLILQVFGVRFQLVERIFTRHVDVHNRELRKVNLLNIRVAFQVGWKVGFGFIDRVRHLLFGNVNVDSGVEFNHHKCHILNGVGGDFLNSVNALDLLFNRFGNQVFDVFGAGARINRRHENGGYHDVGELLLRDALKDDHPDQRNQHGEDVHRSAVVDRPVGGFKVFDMVFFHGSVRLGCRN